MNPNIKDAIVTAFVADALSLGVHWVYDTSAIEKKYGRLQTMVTPKLAPYHKSRQKGEFTHYGDQMMVLLESISDESGFNLNHFSDRWQKMFLSYDGYMDHATKETLENFNLGKGPEASGSMSTDLGGVSRIAPLILYCWENKDAFAAAARAQTAMTHRQAGGLACAQLFALTALKVLEGKTPVKGLKETLDQMDDTFEIQALVKAGIESRSKDTCETIVRFGQECSVKAALPSTIHLIAKYEDNLKQALIENIMAGGDSSARGMLAGFILGCYQGLDGLPKQWLDDMIAFEKIIRLMH